MQNAETMNIYSVHIYSSLFSRRTKCASINPVPVFRCMFGCYRNEKTGQFKPEENLKDQSFKEGMRQSCYSTDARKCQMELRIVPS